MNTYDIIYLLSNIFGTYTIWKFMCIFFNRDNINPKYESITYVMYYIAIGLIYIYFNTPIINVLSNLFLFYLLTLNYPSKFKFRLINIVCIYTILISAETFTILILSILDLNKYTENAINIELIFSYIFSKIISFITLLTVSNFKMLKSNINITLVHWSAVFIIPLGTMFSTFILMMESSHNNIILIFLGILIMFIINFYVFYLYDTLLQSYEEKMETNLIKQQNKAIIQQLNIINISQENLKLLRHDIKLHISALKALIEKNYNSDALIYIQRTFSCINYVDEYAKSGNAEIDSILNYKIYEAKKENIKVSLNIQIPDKLCIHPFDLVTILGNLLDNAIKAASKSTKERSIDISIEFEKNILYICLINSYSGELININNKFMTTQVDQKNHGLGLKSVHKSLEKYNGAMNISYEKNTFFVNALLYNNEIIFE